jgi:hypothetical protein
MKSIILAFETLIIEMGSGANVSGGMMTPIAVMNQEPLASSDNIKRKKKKSLILSTEPIQRLREMKPTRPFKHKYSLTHKPYLGMSRKSLGV